jgi:hypothetical protein
VEALSTMPHHFTPSHRAGLERLYGTVDAEWIVMGAAMMGFLNKFMDALGVELELEPVSDVADLIEPTGWSVGQHGRAESAHSNGASPGRAARGGLPPTDSVLTLLRVVRRGPGGCWDEPLLTTMNLAKPRRALAAMLRHNLDAAAESVLRPAEIVESTVWVAVCRLIRRLTLHHALEAAGLDPLPA